MYQYYIIEIKKLPNGEYEHNVFWEYDADQQAAQRKAESKGYDLLSKAALSNTVLHSVTVLSDDGFTVLSRSYRNNTVVETTGTDNTVVNDDNVDGGEE